MKLTMIFLAIVSMSLACRPQKHSSPVSSLGSGDIPPLKEEGHKETPDLGYNQPDKKIDDDDKSKTSSSLPSLQASNDVQNEIGDSIPSIPDLAPIHETTPVGATENNKPAMPPIDEEDDSDDGDLVSPEDNKDEVTSEAPEPVTVGVPTSGNNDGAPIETPATSSDPVLPTTALTTLTCSLNGASISSSIYALVSGEIPSVICTVLNYKTSDSVNSPKLSFISNSCGTEVKFNELSPGNFELKGNLGGKTSCSFHVAATDHKGSYLSSSFKRLIIKKGRYLVEAPLTKLIRLGQNAFTASDKIVFLRSGFSQPLSLEGFTLSCESYTLGVLTTSGCPENLTIGPEGQLSFFPLQKGTILIRFKATNANGGKFLQSVSALSKVIVREQDTPFVKSSIPSTGSVVNSETASSWILSGSCNVEGGLIKISINEKNLPLNTICNGLTFSETLNLSQETDGLLSISVSLLDQTSMDTLASDSIILVKDISPATVSLSSHIDGAILKNFTATISGLCSEEGTANVFIEYHGIRKHTDCAHGTWFTSISLSVVEEGESFLLEVKHRDLAKNPETVVPFHFQKYGFAIPAN